jgi:hypothetical protein
MNSPREDREFRTQSVGDGAQRSREPALSEVEWGPAVKLAAASIGKCAPFYLNLNLDKCDFQPSLSGLRVGKLFPQRLRPR